MSGDDFRDDRFQVISQLFIPAPEIPPGGRFGSDFREDAVPLALENLSKCIADCLNFFVRRCDCQLITFGFVLMVTEIAMNNSKTNWTALNRLL
jgi:hypothetical protein